MATDRDPSFEDKPTAQSPAYSIPAGRVDMRTTERVQPARSSGPSLGTILTSCFLSLVMGGIGAWAYTDYIGPYLAKRHAGAAENRDPMAQTSAAKPSEDTARLNDLSGKLDELQSRVDRLPKATSSQDLEQLRERVALVDDLSRKVDALSLRVSALPGKVDQDSRKITTLAADLQGMRNEVDSLRNNVKSSPATKPASIKEERPMPKAETPSDRARHSQPLAASEAPREIPPPMNSMLHGGVEFFQNKHYDEAFEFFNSLAKAQTDDARVWYYAALSRGLATRDWKGETERLVSEGMQREKAGKPEKAKIDAAFTDLTQETGKDWLAFYRHKAE